MKNIKLMIISMILIALPASITAQISYKERKKFLADEAQTTDDPRRLPTGNELRGPEGVLVLKGGNIFDATGSKVYTGNIVIERNKIVNILKADDHSWPKDAQVMDVSGMTVMPGMIDLHVHLTEAEELSNPAGQSFGESDNAERALLGTERLRFYIESGITSIRDLASHGMVPFYLKEWTRQNRIPGPRVFAAG
jgi:imidazolonepropionase-like amidohydrolase